MWYRSYRNHAIMAFPSFDTVTSLWAPQASISWVEGVARKSVFVRFAKRLVTEGEAVGSALIASQEWIDKRLTTIDKSPQLHRGDETHSMTSAGSLPGDDTPGSARDVKSARRAPRILTYPQFKSLMEKSGFGGSERSLHKSYTALAELRRQNHCSWAQIKSKMEHVPQPPAVHAKVYRTKNTPLPLTLRAWRRVI